ncbi:MAG: sensor histidine kinase [Stenomitos rutilans HA7619-LM2]|jgi:signal transduction histidine kinase|nr:sensor histidine kinase [Stenomitos rutilans HA7619-LM2]
MRVVPLNRLFHSHESVEPGIVWGFRLIVGVQWLLLGLFLVVTAHRSTLQSNYSAIAAWLQSTVLLIYLSSRWSQRQLGEVYLPIAIVIATLEPLLSQAIATHLNLQAGLSPDAALVNPRRLYIQLLLPLLFICMQYGYRALVSFILGTGATTLLLAHWLDPAQGTIFSSMSSHVIDRTMTFTLAGVAIILLSKVQRQQRRELMQKNAQLADYATTLEALTTSRERNRLARELHDTLAHTLSALSVQLKALEVLFDQDPQAAHALLKQTQELTRAGLQDSRRALQALRASSVEALGLVGALRKLVEQAAARSSLNAILDLPDSLIGLNPALEQQLYRIAEEAVNNVVRHAHASQVSVALRQHDHHLILEIIDDGMGFNPDKPLPKGHYGLTGMQERSRLINGRLEIRSSPQQGTMVWLQVEV